MIVTTVILGYGLTIGFQSAIIKLFQNFRKTGDMMNNWNWNKMIPSWDYYDLVHIKWPGWNKDPHTEQPYFSRFSIIKGTAKSSYEIANEWDDITQGNFWYRDFTDSGLPFVDDGEKYETLFVFQFKEDWEKFKGYLGI